MTDADRAVELLIEASRLAPTVDATWWSMYAQALHHLASGEPDEATLWMEEVGADIRTDEERALVYALAEKVAHV